jgi:hypothetical protein
MNPWPGILLLSAIVGAVGGLLLHERRAVRVGGAVPWTGVLVWLLYNEVFVPAVPGEGASMWPIALLIAGTIAALVGATVAHVVSSRK